MCFILKEKPPLDKGNRLDYYEVRFDKIQLKQRTVILKK